MTPPSLPQATRALPTAFGSLGPPHAVLVGPRRQERQVPGGRSEWESEEAEAEWEEEIEGAAGEQQESSSEPKCQR